MVLETEQRRRVVVRTETRGAQAGGQLGRSGRHLSTWALGAEWPWLPELGSGCPHGLAVSVPTRPGGRCDGTVAGGLQGLSNAAVLVTAGALPSTVLALAGQCPWFSGRHVQTSILPTSDAQSPSLAPRAQGSCGVRFSQDGWVAGARASESGCPQQPRRPAGQKSR